MMASTTKRGRDELTRLASGCTVYCAWLHQACVCEQRCNHGVMAKVCIHRSSPHSKYLAPHANVWWAVVQGLRVPCANMRRCACAYVSMQTRMQTGLRIFGLRLLMPTAYHSSAACCWSTTLSIKNLARCFTMLCHCGSLLLCQPRSSQLVQWYTEPHLEVSDQRCGESSVPAF